MHSQETQQKFIERRAEGWTFTRIATELGVAKTTLIEWSRRFRFEIQNRKALELDALQDRILGTRQHRLSVLAEKLGKIEAELRTRDLARISTAQLYSLAEALRRQIERETGDITFVSPVKDIPSAEYVEEVQQWKP
jgi:transcriptional regulator with XRE-family HTH domain